MLCFQLFVWGAHGGNDQADVGQNDSIIIKTDHEGLLVQIRMILLILYMIFAESARRLMNFFDKKTILFPSLAILSILCYTFFRNIDSSGTFPLAVLSVEVKALRILQKGGSL